jgi:hypothetical protein
MENIGQRGYQGFVEGLAQETTGAMKPGLHRLRAQTQMRGGLLDAHLLNVAQHEDNTEMIR